MAKVDKIRKSVYSTYRSMLGRCYRHSCGSYKNYGGRGIRVCAEWLSSFESFYFWSLANGFSIGLQIDRINNSGDYTPDNCRWVTRKENNNNRRNNRLLEFNGVLKTVSQWSDETGIKADTIYKRMNKGMIPELVLLNVNFNDI